jgi:hypothetical protein
MEFDVDWGDEKNEVLTERYGFGFERVVEAIASGSLLDDRAHPNTSRYGHQFQLVVEIGNYVWVVPYVGSAKLKFLKTFFPSRVETQKYLGSR